MTFAEIAPEYWLFGGAAAISLIAYVALILVPAIGSFGRAWEKTAAGFLSLFVLVSLVALGVAAGLSVVYFWPDIKQFLP